jgi:uncharacterized protein
MSKMIFVNLPVADIAASTRFYAAIGCVKNAQFSDDKASSMTWSDAITFQLLTREYFSTFTSKAIPDAHQTCQMLLALTCDSREAVNAISAAAASAGGRADIRGTMDLGWLYNRAFADPDGHVFEAVWLDANAMPSATGK